VHVALHVAGHAPFDAPLSHCSNPLFDGPPVPNALGDCTVLSPQNVHVPEIQLPLQYVNPVLHEPYADHLPVPWHIAI